MPATNQLEVCAALADMVYHRADTNGESDQAIALNDIGNPVGTLSAVNDATISPLLPSGSGLQVGGNGYVYDSATGFVGLIVRQGTKVIVSYRGTDAGNTRSFDTAIAIVWGSADPARIDNNDMQQNRAMGSGTYEAICQSNDAIALAEIARQLAGGAIGDYSNVIVTGQSLGGGLAGIVGAVTGAETYLVSPAPFLKQVVAIADHKALLVALGSSNASYLSSTFFELPEVDQISLLDIASTPVLGEGLDSYLNGDPTTRLAAASALGEAYDTSRDASLGSYNSHIASSNFHVDTNKGEILSDNPYLVLNVLTDAFKAPAAGHYYDLGKASQIGLHSPSLHALAIRTESTSEKLTSLLHNDAQLRQLLIDDVSASGPIGHARTDAVHDSSSAIELDFPDAGVLTRALWKSVGIDISNHKDLWSYFYKFFGQTIHLGAAADGIQADGELFTGFRGIHGGILKLSLGVLRDALQNTGSLAEAQSNLNTNLGQISGADWNFAGQKLDGTTEDKIVIHLDAIKQTNAVDGDGATPYQEANGRPLGESDIEWAIFQAIKADLHLSLTASDLAASGILGITPTQLIDGSAALPSWSVLVAQAGSDNGALNYDGLTSFGGVDASKSHVIIGGGGADSIHGSTAKDYLIGGAGNDTFAGNGGSDILTGGAGQDVYVASGSNGNVIFIGGSGDSSANTETDSADYAANFNSQNFTVTAGSADYGTPVQTALISFGGSPARVDTIIQVENITLGDGDDKLTLAGTDALQSLTVDLGAGQNWVDLQNSGSSFTEPPMETGPLRINFSTTKSDDSPAGETTQLVTIDAEASAALRNAPMLFVDGQQLVGGAKFLFNSLDYKLGGSIPNDLKDYDIFPSQAEFASDPYISDLEYFILVTEVNDKIKNTEFGGFGGLDGVYYSSQFLNFQEAWVRDYGTSTFGVNGEQYTYDPSESVLTINWRMPGGAAPYTIRIENWQNGDFGIRLDDSPLLDSGTNNDGAHTNPISSNLDLEKIQQELASVGFVIPPENALGRWTPGQDDPITRQGTDGQDQLTAGGGNDLIAGRGDADTLSGGAGIDSYFFADGDGDDVINDEGGKIIFEEGVKLDEMSIETVSGAGGYSDLLIKYGSSETITIVNNGSDVQASDWDLSVTAISDQPRSHDLDPPSGLSTVPSSGDDFLKGTDGADTLAGGAGNDFLHGQAGTDTYVFNLGDGKDTIRDLLSDDDKDIVLLGSGIKTSDVTVTQAESGTAFVLSIIGTSDQIIIEDQMITASTSIDEVHFASGAIWTMQDLLQMTSLPTSADQVIYGDIYANTISGGSGDDVLIGRSGSDTYMFGVGDGHDIIRDGGHAGAIETVAGGADTVVGEIDTVVFGPDILASSVDVVAVGYDIEIRVNIDDVVVLEDATKGTNFSADSVKFQDGTIWNYDELEAKSGELGRTINGTGGADTLVGSGAGDTISGLGGDDTIEASDGADSLYGGDDNDLIYGQGGDDRFFGEAGNDTIAGGQGADTVEGGDGEDRLVGHTGNDRLNDDGGNDVLDGRGGNDILDGGIGQDTLVGGSDNDILYGADDSDTLSGNAGNDTMSGMAGADLYTYLSNHGDDVIDDDVGSASDVDVLRFDDQNAIDIALFKDGNDLKLRSNATGAIITVVDHFLSPTLHWGIEQITFEDSTNWDLTTIASKLWKMGTASNDTLVGTAAVETLDGGLGDDILQGKGGGDTYYYHSGTGNDTIQDGDISTSVVDTLWLGDLNPSDVMLSRVGNDIAINVIATGETLTINNQFNSSFLWSMEQMLFEDGTTWDKATINANAWYRGTASADTFTGTNAVETFIGNGGDDYLTGGIGNDTYIYASGDGNDTIVEGGYTADTDTLKLSNLNASDIFLTHSGTNLLVTTSATGQTITIVDEFKNTINHYGVEQIVFADKSTWDLAAINANAWYRGTSGNDTLTGVTSNTAETFVGGLGNDTLQGNPGSDTYIYASGDGSDLINDAGSSAGDTDVLKLTNVSSTGIVVGRTTYDLQIAISATGDVITIKDHFKSTSNLYGIEQLVFTDTTWDASTINGKAWFRGTSGADSLTGTIYADTLDGGAGNDTLAGGSGNDSIIGGTGDDQLTDSSGNDIFVFATGFGHDTISGFASTTGVGDQLQISMGTAFDTVSEVLAVAVQSGTTTTITFDVDHSITLNSVTKSSLNSNDFLFV